MAKKKMKRVNKTVVNAAKPARLSPSESDVSEIRPGQEKTEEKARQDEQIRPRKSKQTVSHDEPAHMVRRSTMFMCVALALVLGIYAGTLLPALMSGPAAAPAGMGGAAPQAQSAQTTEQEQNIARLAGHIQEMETAVRKNPEDVKSWVQLGNLYFDTGKAQASINAYERALLLKPDEPDVLTDLGIMYREAGKFDLAVQSFSKAVQLNPKHQNALFNSGVVLYYDLERKAEARKMWQQLLGVNPKAMAPNGKAVADMLRELK